MNEQGFVIVVGITAEEFDTFLKHSIREVENKNVSMGILAHKGEVSIEYYDPGANVTYYGAEALMRIIDKIKQREEHWKVKKWILKK